MQAVCMYGGRLCEAWRSDGVIDKAELKTLLQSTDNGLQRVTKHAVRRMLCWLACLLCRAM